MSKKKKAPKKGLSRQKQGQVLGVLRDRVESSINSYNTLVANASLTELRGSAAHRREQGDVRIVGNIGKMKKADLIKMLTMDFEDFVSEGVREALGLNKIKTAEGDVIR